MKSYEIGAAAAAVALLAPSQANAGAWMAEGGHQDILTQALGQTEEEGSYYETSAYWEHGVGEHTALIAAPWVRSGADTGDEGWRGEAMVGFKSELIREDHGAMALQGGVVWSSEVERGCGEGGAEVRWLGGMSFGDEGRGFVNLEAAAMMHGGGCTGERLDISAGYRPNDKWLAMAQVFLDNARYGEEAVNGQISLVRFGGYEGRGIQLGLRARLDG